VFQSIVVSQQIASLTWSAVSGHTYRLQYNVDLGAANWSNLAPDSIATGATAGTTDSLGAEAQRFYRVILLP